MKYLYAPWRSTYTQETVRGKDPDTPSAECVFCQKIAAKDDEENFILRRFPNVVVVLNLYPYNAGHLLVVPLEHCGNLEELSEETRAQMMGLIAASSRILREELGAEGVNVGINIGKASGAGIPSHVHAHILPRWSGDTNFLPTLADTKQISFDLGEIYRKLKPSFDALT